MTTTSKIRRTDLAKQILAGNHQWWHDREGNKLNRDPGELLMLITSELAEAMEGLRKNLMDDKLPHRKMEEVEMADTYIRLMDFAAGFDVMYWLDFHPEKVFETFNSNRAANLWKITKLVTKIDENDKLDAVAVSRAVVAVEEYCAYYGLDLFGAIEEKRAFNAVREDHKWENRLKDGGKKF